jgi:hypothetical protein
VFVLLQDLPTLSEMRVAGFSLSGAYNFKTPPEWQMYVCNTSLPRTVKSSSSKFATSKKHKKCTHVTV